MVLCAVGIAVCGAAYAGWKIRKRMIADRALEDGRALVKAGNYREGARQLRLYVERYPNKAEVLKEYAEANLKVSPLEAGNVAQAIGAYRRLVRVQPTSENFRTAVELYFQVGEFAEAALMAERWRHPAEDSASADPCAEPIAARVWHARCLIGLRDFKTARDIIEEIVTDKCDDPDALDAYLLWAELERVASGDDRTWRDAAVAHYAAALAEDRFPDSAKALALLSRTRRERGILNGDPDDAPANPEDVPQILRRTPEENLAAATALNSDDPSVRLVLFTEWLDRGDAEQARRQLDAMWKTGPQTLEQYTIRNVEQWRMFLYRAETEWAQHTKEFDQVSPRVEAGLKDLPTRQRTLFLPAAVQFFLSRGEPQRAEQLLAEYEARLPEVRDVTDDDRLAIQLTRARICSVRDDPYGTINHLGDFMVRRPNDLDGLKLLLWAFDRTGQAGRKAVTLEQYVRVAPTDLSAIVQLARQRLVEGDPQMALTLAGRAAENLRKQAAAVRERLAEVEAGAADRLKRQAGEITRLLGEAEVVQFQAQAMYDARGGAAPSDTGGARPARNESQLKALLDLQGRYPNRLDIRLMRAALDPDQAVSILEEAVQVEDLDRRAEAYIQLARVLAGQNRGDEAIARLDEAVAKVPDVPAVRVALSEFQERAGRIDEARATLEQARAAYPDRAEARRAIAFARAALEFRAGERQAAIDVVQRHLAEDSKDRPADVATREYLLNVPEIRDDPGRAAELVEQIRKIEGDSGLTWRLHEAHLAMRSDGWKDRPEQKDLIRSHLEYCLQADPGAEAPAVLLAGFHIETSDGASAETVLRKVIDRNPGASTAADRLMALLNRQGRPDEVKALHEALAQRGNRRSAENLAVAFITGELEDARATLKRQVAQDPKDVDRLVLLARLSFAEGKKDEAEEYLTRADAAATDPTRPALARAELREADGRTEDARAILDELVARQPSFEAHQWRAAFHQRHGNPQAAEQDYVQATAFEEHAPAAYLALGRFHLQSGQAEAARQAFVQGYALAPDDVGLGISLMGVLMGSSDEGERAEGQKLLESLHGKHPDHPVILMAHAAQILQSVDMSSDDEETKLLKAEAETSLERAVQADPKLVMAHQLLIRLKTLNADLEGAGMAADRAAAANPDDVGLALSRINIQRQLNPTLARQLARQLAERVPDNVDANYLLATIELRQFGDAQAAWAAIRRVADGSASPAVQQLQAEVLSHLGRASAAVDRLEEFQRDHPDRQTAALAALTAELYLLQLKDRAKAAEWLERARSIDAEDGAVFRVDLAMLLAGKPSAVEYDEAVARLEERQQTQPDDYDSFMLGARALPSADPKYRPVVRSLFDAAVQARPDSIEAHLGRATIAYLSGDRTSAMESFGEVHRIDENSPEALNGLAWLLYEEGTDFHKALEYADRAVRVARSANPNLLDTRGNILFALAKSGDATSDWWHRARIDFERCVNSTEAADCTKTKARVRLGQTLIHLGEVQEAKRHLDEAAQLDASLVDCLDRSYKMDLQDALDALEAGGGK